MSTSEALRISNSSKGSSKTIVLRFVTKGGNLECMKDERARVKFLSCRTKTVP